MKKYLLTLAALTLLFAGADAKGVKKGRHKAGAKAKPTYYVNGDGTYSTTPPDAKRPSPYKGNRVPENDGQKKNKERNLRYGNGQEPALNPGK